MTDKVASVDRLHHMLLECSDLAASEHFYLETLDFAVRKREEFRDGRKFVSTVQGLALVEANRRVTVKSGSLEHFCFSSTNVDTIAKNAESSGYQILRGPGPGPYGHTVYIEDPDGNEVELFDKT